jgi:hypothetical protein|tara:strand:- start:1170 stop:1580 length:411 start_codon:yes stop_codon:yes gene_type:complete
MKNIFDWLKAINTTKPDINSFKDKDWELFNSYMIHRFLSMNRDFLEIVNFVQDYPPQQKKAIYQIYKEYIPKNNKWNKYIKSSIKQPNKELVQYLKEFFKVSSREILDYLKVLKKQEITNILEKQGLNKKEIKKIL